MCGIAGIFLKKQQFSPEKMNNMLQEASRRLDRRGPDGCGSWLSEDYKVGFAHTRLSIVDLTDNGSQPRTSSCGRYVVSFNGEIYNHVDLRCELSAYGYKFSSTSDTEVIAEAVSHWGIELSISKLSGMFAISCWDKAENILCLVRDRIGIKPLSYYRSPLGIVFGSTLNSFRAFPIFEEKISQKETKSYSQFGYTADGCSIFENCRKVAPGQIYFFKNGDFLGSHIYWTLGDIIAKNKISENIGVAEIEKLLRSSVQARKPVEVEYAAFLSGGVDSSLIASIMQADQIKPISTFSIGFDDAHYDESKFSKEVSKVIGTNHNEIQLDALGARDLVPKLAAAFDEPFADSSQIPMLLLSEITRKHAKVALSGDGGDELFCGYRRYGLAAKFSRFSQSLPEALKKSVSKRLAGLNAKELQNLLYSRIGIRLNLRICFRFLKLIRAASAQTSDEMYFSLLSQDQEGLNPHASFRRMPSWENLKKFNLTDIECFQYIDVLTYLVDDILVKVDRASMYSGLEVRVPMLDHRLVEAAFTMSSEKKYYGGKGKRPLLDILNRYHPQLSFDRRKTGFAVPLTSWLKSTLRDWADDLIISNDWECDFGISNAVVRHSWEEFLKSKNDNVNFIWNLLMFAQWKRELGR